MPAVEMLGNECECVHKRNGCHLTSVKAVEGGRPGNLYMGSQVELACVGDTPTLWRNILQMELTWIPR
jgi:hypothetical protein